MSSGLLGILILFKALIRDEPYSVTRHKERQERMEDVLVGQLQEEDDSRNIASAVAARNADKRTCCCGIFEATSYLNCICCRIPWFEPAEAEHKVWTEVAGNDNSQVEYMHIKHIRTYDLLTEAVDVMANLGVTSEPIRPYEDHLTQQESLKESEATRRKSEVEL